MLQSQVFNDECIGEWLRKAGIVIVRTEPLNRKSIEGKRPRSGVSCHRLFRHRLLFLLLRIGSKQIEKRNPAVCTSVQPEGPVEKVHLAHRQLPCVEAEPDLCHLERLKGKEGGVRRGAGGHFQRFHPDAALLQREQFCFRAGIQMVGEIDRQAARSQGDIGNVLKIRVEGFHAHLFEHHASTAGQGTQRHIAIPGKAGTFSGGGFQSAFTGFAGKRSEVDQCQVDGLQLMDKQRFDLHPAPQCPRRRFPDGRSRTEGYLVHPPASQALRVH